MWFSFHQFLPVWNIHLNSLLISALSGDAKLPTNVLLGRGGSLLLWRTPDPSQDPLKSCDPHSRMVSTSIHNPEQLKQQANVQVLGFPCVMLFSRSAFPVSISLHAPWKVGHVLFQGKYQKLWTFPSGCFLWVFIPEI